MGVPMQRPENMGTRTTLTDAEFAQREAQAKRQAAADNESTAASDGAPGIGPPSYWTERGTPTRQTSLVIDLAEWAIAFVDRVQEEKTAEGGSRGGKGFRGNGRARRLPTTISTFTTAASREACWDRSFRLCTTTATRFCSSRGW